MARGYVEPWLTEAIAQSRVIPIPLRPDLVVRVVGIPPDITEQEAGKIAAVVKALVDAEAGREGGVR